MRRSLGVAIVVCLLVRAAGGETLDANNLALKSTGVADGGSYILSDNGFVGTYITLAQPGEVTIDVSADGLGDANLGIAIDDCFDNFTVGADTQIYSRTYSLPAGTHFLRTELNNDPGIAERQLKINSVSVSGAAFSNLHDNDHAAAASDTYIANYRRGPAQVRIAGVAAGQTVGVSLQRIAFDFGAGAHVAPTGGLLNNQSTTKKRRYQENFLKNFNAITTAESSYWLGNEPEQGEIEMRGTNETLDFARAHGLAARQHNAIWDFAPQSPEWVLDLRAQALADQTAKDDLREAIRDRIEYYVGNPHGTFDSIDVYNESWNHGERGTADTFWNLYGAEGVAEIYHEAKTAAPDSRLWVNDFLVVQNHSDEFNRHIDEIRKAGVDAGYGEVVDAIGIEYYHNNSALPTMQRDFMKGLQNMNVQHLPNALTEFGVFTPVTPEFAADMLGRAMRMMFGNSSSTGFTLWDWTNENGGAQQFAVAAALYTVNTSNWNTMAITPAGKIWQDTLGIQDWDGNPDNGWTTQLTTTVGPDGAIDFNGYYGDYELTINGVKYYFTLEKGDTQYSIGLAGDFNGDGQVDAADYTLWRDGEQDPDAYLAWQENFGTSIIGGGSLSVVPEVASLLQAAFAMGGLAATACRPRRLRQFD